MQTTLPSTKYEKFPLFLSFISVAMQHDCIHQGAMHNAFCAISSGEGKTEFIVREKYIYTIV